MPAMSTCSPSSRDSCNGGQCVLLNGAVYTCRCRDGFTGAYCENSWVDSMHLILMLIVLMYLLRYQRMCFESLVRSELLFRCHFSSFFLLCSVWVGEPVMIWSMLTLVSVPIGYFVRNATPRVSLSRSQVHRFWWVPVNVSSALS